jgi:hypothetical protein
MRRKSRDIAATDLRRRTTGILILARGAISRGGLR